MTSAVLLFLSSASLGVFLGAQLLEAMLMVPYWKGMTPDEFFKFYSRHGHSIHKFFSPLTIVATLVTLCSVTYHVMYWPEAMTLLMVLGLSTAAFFSTYFLYFKQVNDSFTNRTLSDDDLHQELNRWGQWHWARVILECIAFVCSLVLLLQYNS